MNVNLSRAVTSVLAVCGIGANASHTIGAIPNNIEIKVINKVHAKDLQTRLQVVCDRRPAYETPDIYGTNPNGFRQYKLFNKAEIAKMSA